METAMLIHTDKAAGRMRNRPLKDYTGQRFGRLTAMSLVARDTKWCAHLWSFKCDCGAEKAISIKSVTSGNTASCGCSASESLKARNTTHGLSRGQPSEYRSWKDMRSRCLNGNNTSYADYGGRGISICSRWASFAVFFADMGARPNNNTLDRVDVNGGYSPENCRWAAADVQANNKRTNRTLTISGETRTLAQWCQHFNIEPSKVRYRLNNGWGVKDAFSACDFRAAQITD